MDGKIIQFVREKEYEAVLTDAGKIYERVLGFYSTGSMYKSSKWGPWYEKTFEVAPNNI